MKKTLPVKMRTMEYGELLLLKRYREGGIDAVSRGAASRANSVALPSPAVLARYRGMDGIPVRSSEIILLPEGFVSWSSFDAACAAAEELKGDGVELLCLVRDKEEPVVPYAEFLGFDCGVCEGPENCYSVIFHEVLFGKSKALVDFATRLNENFLFRRLVDAQSLMSRRASYSTATNDVLEKFEDSDRPGVFAVYSFSSGWTR